MKNETKLSTLQQSQMKKVLEKISSFYFESLSDTHAKLFFHNTDEVASFKTTTHERIHEEFSQSLKRGLQTFSGATKENDHFLLLGKSIDVYKAQTNRGRILNLIPRSNPEITADGLLENLEFVFLAMAGEIGPQYAGLFDIFANALQEATITVPQWLDTRNDQVAPQIEKVLEDVLKLIYQARLKYSTMNAAQSAYKESATSLYKEIYEVENQIWLPMRPPLTAPLEGEAIKNIYARNEEAARRLAQQIVKSDGIILISGYRGVGKSTFLNATLSKHVPAIEENQLESVKTQVVRVQINVAKASNIENVLRLCIRELYRVKRDQPDIPFLNTEIHLIEMANLCTTFRVNVSQGEMLSHAKEIKSVFGFDPGAVFSKLVVPIALPILSTFSQTNNKTWQNKFDTSISLLDYDEDRAEEDLIRLIEQTAEPRKNKVTGETVRLKLVFVFDELDKLAAPKQNQIVSRLKNLFLTPGCVFVLVTSKDFYYLLEEEKKKEDSLLGSYFSAVVTVPLFSASETESLIRRLVAIPIPTEDEIKKDPSLSRYQKFNDYLKLLAKYLTYQSFGLPREIVRTLRENQQWKDIGLQPYITDSTFDKDEVRVFGKMQDVIEQILTAESSLVGETSESATLSENEVWLNDIRREQVRRGLYVLLDELQLQNTLEVNWQQELTSKDTALKQIYVNNFKGLPYNRFLSILQNLGRKLHEVSDEAGPLFSYETSGDSNENFSIRVSNNFYVATNQSTHLELEDAETKEITPAESLKRVYSWLEKEYSPSSVNLLLLYLRRCEKPLPLDVQEGIYKAMISSDEDLGWRAQLAGYLEPKELFEKHESRLNENAFSWLGKEKSEAIVSIVLDWAISNKLSGVAQIGVLHNILLRAKNSPATLTRSINALSEFAANGKLELPSDILRDVVAALDKRADIPKELLKSLIVIAKAGSDYLIDTIMVGGFSAISIETFQAILLEQPYPNIEALWKNSAPDSVTKQRLFSAVLLQSAENDETPTFIQEWLNQTEWTNNDLAVLREVSNVNKRFLNSLKLIVKSKQKDTLLDAAIGEIRAVSSKTETKSTTEETPPKPIATSKTRSVRISLILSGLIGIGFLVGVYALQVDVNTSATILSRILTRTSEIMYLILAFITIILIFFGVGTFRDKSTRSASVIFFFLSIITGVISSLVFWWRYAAANAPITFRGQLPILGLSLTGIVVPFFSYIILVAILGRFERRK